MDFVKMNLPLIRWEPNSRKWIKETAVPGSIKIMRRKAQSQASNQKTVTIGEGLVQCQNCGEGFEIWGTNKSSSPSFCSFQCMKKWIDYHIDNKDNTAGKKRKSSMSIPSNSKLPMIRWDRSSRKWITG